MNHEEALSKIEKEPLQVTEETKLSILWDKIRPLVALLGTIFGKKVKPYIKAFIAAIDAIVEQEDE